MADEVPIDWRQYEIGGVVMGRRTPYRIMEVVYGAPESVVADADVPRNDGIRFGRDYLRGRTITIMGRVKYPYDGRTDAAMKAYEQLEAVWNDQALRDNPGAVIPLRFMRHPGRLRRVYGRPRKIQSVSKMSSFGDIPFTAEFKTFDHLYYSDEVFLNNITLVPPSVLGLQAPLIAPLHSVPLSERPTQVTNTSESLDSWISFSIHGPIQSPKVTLTNEWVLDLHDLNLAFDQFVVVDPRPWNRGVFLNGVTPINGRLSTTSVPLSKMKLPPGDHEIVLTGSDVTGTAYMNMAWYQMYSSY